jgi:hypothetical protein
MGSPVASTFTATGQSAIFCPKSSHPGDGPAQFSFSLRGTFVATVQLERSLDGGTNWLPMTALGTAIPFSAACTENFEEADRNAIYRANCTAYTSGTVNYRLSQ